MANLKINILAQDKTKAALSSVQAGLGRLKATIFSIQGALIGIGGGLAVRSLVNVGSEVENLGVRFNFLFGNVKEGTKAFNNLINFAAKVPFSLQEISSASGNLAVVAKDADDLSRILKITGNVAAVTGLDFRQTAEQIQRAFSGGIAAADVFRERGVRALLGFEAGVSKTAAETVEAFEKVFGPDGRFGKATEVLATTFTGTLSMLSDKLFKFRLETNRAGFFDFIKNALVVTNRLIEENSKMMIQFSSAVGQGLVTFIKQALIGGARLLDLFKFVFQAVGLGIKGLIDLVGALPAGIREIGIVGFLLLGKRGKIIVASIAGLLKLFKVDLEAISNKIFGAADNTEAWGENTKKVQKFIEMIEKNIKLSNAQMKELMEALSNIEKDAKKVELSFQKIAEALETQIGKNLQSINETIGKMIVGSVQSFSRALAETIVLGKKLNVSLKEIAQKLLVDMLAFAINLVLQERIRNFLIEKGIIKQKEQTNVLGGLVGLNLIDLGIQRQKTAEIQQQNKDLEKQKKIQGTMMLMSGNPLGFLGFFAKGGAVSKGQPVIVGEQGPELFVPNQTGQITQNARGAGMGGAVVNFNITTLDASGFEDLLVRSRGTISNIINQSLNERGAASLV
ncbi:MAG: hypothetical protein VW810_00605 [Pelagibacteraceae bacterium]